MEAMSRLTNAALLALLVIGFATGWVAFELAGQPARAVLVLHAQPAWQSCCLCRGSRLSSGVG
jgi:hypothetical protein